MGSSFEAWRPSEHLQAVEFQGFSIPYSGCPSIRPQELIRPGPLDRQAMAFRSGAHRHPQMNFFARQASQDEFAAILGTYAGLRRP
jgi:hypothetical protein